MTGITTSRMIRSGTVKIFRDIKTIKSVIAEVKKNNIISQRAFQKAGYKYVSEAGGRVVYEYSVNNGVDRNG